MKRNLIVSLLATAVALSLLALTLGRGGLDLDDARTWFLILEIRLPRVLAAIAVGLSTALATTLLQFTLKAKLAEPALFGVSAYAALGTIAGILLGLSFGSLETFILAVALSTLGVWPIWWASARLRSNPNSNRESDSSTLALAGVALGSFAVAMVGLASFAIPDPRLRSVTLWAFGSLSLQTLESSMRLLAVALSVVILAWLIRHKLARLALSPAILRGMGIDEIKLAQLALVLVAVLVATSSFTTGSVAFVGLLAATIARNWFGSSLPAMWLGSTLIAISVILLSDLIARNLAAPLELPLGLVTAVLGAPLLIATLVRKRNA